MPGLLIKEFPSDLHAKLKAQAAKNKRSMTKEALHLLEIMLNDPANGLSAPLPDPVPTTVLLTDEMIDQAKHEGRA